MSNFCFPIGEPIHNDRVKLIAFDVDLHSSAFVTETWNYPQMLKDTPSGPFQTVDEFKNLVTQPDSVSTFASWNPKTFVFSVIDTTRPSSPEDKDGELAGLIGYDNASKVSRSAELYVFISPRFQRTHVTTNAVGLLLQHAFAPPEQGGLSLVRTEWICSTANRASARLAERIGHEKVGVIPFHIRFPGGKKTGKVGNGRPPPPGTDEDDLWRDSEIYTMSWIEWDAHRAKIQSEMDRRT